MRGLAVIAVLAVACHHEAPVRSSYAHERCTLRIAQHRTFADGEPMSRQDAVAHCKRARGGVVVVLEHHTPAPEWDATRSALEREGVRIYVQGRLCYVPDGRDCRPPPAPGGTQPRREIVGPITPGPVEPSSP